MTPGSAVLPAVLLLLPARAPGVAGTVRTRAPQVLLAASPYDDLDGEDVRDEAVEEREPGPVVDEPMPGRPHGEPPEEEESDLDPELESSPDDAGAEIMGDEDEGRDQEVDEEDEALREVQREETEVIMGDDGAEDLGFDYRPFHDDAEEEDLDRSPSGESAPAGARPRAADARPERP